jgi:hypothetical protein
LIYSQPPGLVQIVIVLLGIISDNPWEGLGWAMVGTLLGETLNFL